MTGLVLHISDLIIYLPVRRQAKITRICSGVLNAASPWHQDQPQKKEDAVCGTLNST